MSAPIATGLRPGTYRIDTARSSVRFTAYHFFGIGPVNGTFAVRAGTVHIGADREASTVTATVDSDSFRTDKPRRDTDVTTNFLHSAAYPDLSFESTGLDGRRLTGTMTVHGRTEPVTFDVTHAFAVDGGCRFVATARIDRYAFGVTRGRGLIGRYLDVTVDVHATA